MFRRIWRNVFWESIELLVALLCLFSGAAILSQPGRLAPSSLTSQPPIVVIGWAISLLIGGGMNGLGIILSNLYTRRAGLILLCGACVTFGLSLITFGHPVDVVGVITYLVAALAFGARYRALGLVQAALHLVVRTEQTRRDKE